MTNVCEQCGARIPATTRCPECGAERTATISGDTSVEESSGVFAGCMVLIAAVGVLALGAIFPPLLIAGGFMIGAGLTWMIIKTAWR